MAADRKAGRWGDGIVFSLNRQSGLATSSPPFVWSEADPTRPVIKTFVVISDEQAEAWVNMSYHQRVAKYDEFR